MQSGGAPQFNSGAAASQQTTANANAAINQQRLNMVNQQTPYGSLNYTETGGTYDYDHNWIPQYTATTSLSPDQQKILEQTTGVQQQALGLAPNLLNNVGAATAKPIDFGGAPALPANGQAARDTAYNALMSRTQQQLDRQRSADATLAANQGIAPGSEAWNRLTQHNDQAATDASNQATINASQLAGQDLSQAQGIRNQWINEQLTQHNQPIQDLTSLLGIGGGVTQPSFQNTPQTNVNATDTNSLNMAAYQGQIAGYNAQNATNNALMGGLFGLAGAGLGGVARNPGLFGLGR